MIWLFWVFWDINPCRIFNAKSFLHVYIQIMYDLVVVGFLAYNPRRLFNAKSVFTYIY